MTEEVHGLEFGAAAVGTRGASKRGGWGQLSAIAPPAIGVRGVSHEREIRHRSDDGVCAFRTRGVKGRSETDQ
jgi:hypothetical protein